MSSQLRSPGHAIWAACVAALAGALVCVPSLRAADTESVLDQADRAYRAANYQLAANRLATLQDSLDRLLPQQQILYWDLITNVERASGSIAAAEAAAVRHLALQRQASEIAAGEDFVLERQALMRLAQIKGEMLSNEALRESCRLYREALQLARTTSSNTLLWKAEAHCELAGVLVALNELKEANAEFAAASQSAEAALKMIAISHDTADDYVRGTALVQRTFSPYDARSQKRQANKSLVYLTRALKDDRVSPPIRGKLLVSIAACYRQMGDADESEAGKHVAASAGRRAEHRVLERLLAEISHPELLQVEPVAHVEALIRLADLTDKLDEAPATAANGRSTQLYRDAAKLCEQLLVDVKKANQATKDGAGSPQPGSNDGSRPALGSETECLMRLQLIYTRLGEWDQAIQRAEALCRLRETTLTRDDPNYFRSLSALGSLYAKKARAARMPAVAGDAAGGTPRADIDNALKNLQRAAEFWRRYEPRSLSDLSSTLNYYAEVCRYDGDFQQANKLLDEVAAYESTESTSSNQLASGIRRAEFFLNRGAVQAAVGHFSLALDNYNKAIEIVAGGDTADVRDGQRLRAMIYLNLAQLHKSQRHLDRARSACEEALRAARDAGFTENDLVPFELAQASLLIAEAENSRGSAGAVQGSSENDDRDDTIDVSQKLSQAMALTDGMLQRANNLTDIQLATVRHLQALAHYRAFELCNGGEKELRSAEAIWTKIVDSSGDQAPQIGVLRVRALNFLVRIALHDVSATRELARNADTDEGRVRELVKQSEAQFDNARTWSADAQRQAETIVAYPAVRAQALLARAQVLRAESQIHQAKAELNQDPDGTREREAAAQSKLAAIAALEEALKIIETPRAMTFGAEEERAEYFAQFSPIFDLLVDMHFEEGRYIDAIRVAEQRRSRTYQDQLRTSGIDLYDKAKTDAVKEAQDRYYSALAQLNESWSDTSAHSAILKDLESRRQSLEDARRDAMSTSVAASQLLLQQTEAEPDDWIAEQASGDDIVLVYYVGAERSYLFACSRKLGIAGLPLTVSVDQAAKRSLRPPVSRDGRPIEARALRADDVAQLVLDIRDEIEQARADQFARGDNAAQSIDTTRGGPKLERVLSGKVDSRTDYVVTEILLPAELRQKLSEAGTGHLIVVPDGALHQLPLELLPDGAAQESYLLDTLPPICYAPSLYIHRLMQKERRTNVGDVTLVSVANPKYRALPNTNALLAPELSSAGQEYLKEYFEMKQISALVPLLSSEGESNEVQRAFQAARPDVSVVPLIDVAATETNLKDLLKQPSIGFLHVAAHGFTSQKYNNLLGALALSTPSQPTSYDDGFLALNEVYELKLPQCELAVLSACETNYGPDIPLEAGSTMARAFICAGSRRVVCSHWDVSDAATAKLIGRFMQSVAEGLRDGENVDYSLALRDAKKSLRDDRRTRSPWLWAPFVLIGPPNGSVTTASQAATTAQN